MKSFKDVRIPNTLVLIFFIIASVTAATWSISSEEYDRAERNGTTVVLPGTYHVVQPMPQGVGAVFTAPLKGFVQAANVIAFIFIVGGSFGIINATGAIHSSIVAATHAIRKRKFLDKVTIPLLMILFSLAGTTFGMSEEVLAFIFIFVPFGLALGYDSIVGVAIPFVGAGAGFAGAFLNPFTVGIAQGIAEVPLFSGMGYRLIV